MDAGKSPTATRVSAMPDREAVARQLERMLTNDGFSASKYLREFLQFIVEETLAGRSSKLKGYSIALAVFGRGEDFEPATDPIVRIYAGKLRRALAQYYASQGMEDPVRIKLSKGSYVPAFQAATPPHPLQEPSGAEQPTIVVLPSVALTGDPEQRCFAQGLTEELVVSLTRYRDLVVFSHPVSVDLTCSQVDVPEVAGSVHAQFVLGTAVRQNATRIRVTALLRDGLSGRHLWAERYERILTSENLFAVQDEIASEVVTTVTGQFFGAINRTLAVDPCHRPQDPSTCDAVPGLQHCSSVFGWDACMAARGGPEEAVETQPRFSMGRADLAEIQRGCCSTCPRSSGMCPGERRLSAGWGELIRRASGT